MGLVLLALVAVPFLATVPASAECPGFILGTWEWEYSIGGIGGWTYTPATAGYTIQLELLASGTMKYYENGILQQTHGYELTCGGPQGGTVICDPYNPGQQAYIEMLPDGPRLHLVDQCLDCFGSRYAARGPVATEKTSWGMLKSRCGE
jgi:hypothetical protein